MGWVRLIYHLFKHTRNPWSVKYNNMRDAAVLLPKLASLNDHQKQMFKFLIADCIDLQMCTHATMRHFERIFNLPSRHGGFAVLKYSSDYTGETARLIQLMPHCSLWIVPGSPGYLWWSIIIGCVTISEDNIPLHNSKTFGTSYRMKRGSAVSTFYINSPSVDFYLVRVLWCLSWLQRQQRVKASNEKR